MDLDSVNDVASTTVSIIAAIGSETDKNHENDSRIIEASYIEMVKRNCVAKRKLVRWLRIESVAADHCKVDI